MQGELRRYKRGLGKAVVTVLLVVAMMSRGMQAAAKVDIDGPDVMITEPATEPGPPGGSESTGASESTGDTAAGASKSAGESDSTGNMTTGGSESTGASESTGGEESGSTPPAQPSSPQPAQPSSPRYNDANESKPQAPAPKAFPAPKVMPQPEEKDVLETEILPEIADVAQSVPAPKPKVFSRKAAPVPQPKVWQSGTPEVVFSIFTDLNAERVIDAGSVVSVSDGLTGTIRISKEHLNDEAWPFVVVSGDVEFFVEEGAFDDEFITFRFEVKTEGTHQFIILIDGCTVYSPWIYVAPPQEENRMPEIFLTPEFEDNTDAGEDVFVPEVVILGDEIDEETLHVTLQTSDNPVKELQAELKEGKDLHEVIVEALPADTGKKEVHTLSVEVADKKGNRTKKTLVYMTDGAGSVFVLDEATGALVKEGYTNKAPQLIILQYTERTVWEKQMTLSFNSRVTLLEAGVDYTVAQTKNEKKHCYTYVIKSDNFKEDGIYSAGICTKDDLARIESSRVESSVDFILDRVCPYILTEGIESNGVYEEASHTVTVLVTDDYEIMEVRVTTDGTGEAVFSSEALRALGGKLDVVLEGDNLAHTVRIAGIDKAGNRSEVTYRNVLVTGQEEAQEVTKSGLNADTVLLIVVLTISTAALAAVLQVRRRRK